MRTPGKIVGTRVYIHRSCELRQVPADLLQKAKRYAGAKIAGYTCVRYDRKTSSIAFQFSADFDEADEPTLDRTISVSVGGRITEVEGGTQIWHHKWAWVTDDYQGFDVEASKRRSELWAPHVTKEEKRKIGYKKYWDAIRGRWERI